jgi:hypothetical protein
MSTPEEQAGRADTPPQRTAEMASTGSSPSAPATSPVDVPPKPSPGIGATESSTTAGASGGPPPPPPPDESISGDLTDVRVAVFVAVLLYGALLWCAFRYSGPVAAPLFVLSALFGASLGWVVGILISPYTQKEQSAFGELAKLVYGFITGYVLSKFAPVLQTAISNSNLHTWVVVGVGLVSFFTAVALTYISRRYWVNVSAAEAADRRPREPA